MSTTTFSAIRDRQATLIEALSPGRFTDRLFRLHQATQELQRWANENPQTAFRVFDLVSELGVTTPLVSNTDVIDVEHELALVVAYPHNWGELGADNRRELDDVIEGDLHQLDHAVGVEGYGNYVAGQHLCELRAADILDGPNTSILRLSYRIIYRRARA